MFYQNVIFVWLRPWNLYSTVKTNKNLVRWARNFPWRELSYRISLSFQNRKFSSCFPTKITCNVLSECYFHLTKALESIIFARQGKYKLKVKIFRAKTFQIIENFPRKANFYYVHNLFYLEKWICINYNNLFSSQTIKYYKISLVFITSKIFLERKITITFIIYSC